MSAPFVVGLAPSWRSLLYVPAHQERFVERAHERGADAVILDLEDGVPPADKDAARAALSAAVPSVARSGAAALVRVNSAWTRAWRDLEAAVAAGACGVVLPKVRGGGAVSVISDYLSELEVEAGVPVGATLVLALLEDAAGMLAAREVAACPRVVALIPGNEDLALDLGIEPEPEVMRSTHALLVLAARAEGKLALGTLGSPGGFKDLGAFRERALLSHRFGFSGGTCIHPSQVAVLNEVHAPSAQELEWARQVVVASEAAAGGVTEMDGRMVDSPVVERARRLLERGGRS